MFRGSNLRKFQFSTIPPLFSESCMPKYMPVNRVILTDIFTVSELFTFVIYKLKSILLVTYYFKIYFT